ncbi:MAG: hypothetical protein U0936_11455 [Planctomycetaceae bacterium]
MSRQPGSRGCKADAPTPINQAFRGADHFRTDEFADDATPSVWPVQSDGR